MFAGWLLGRGEVDQGSLHLQQSMMLSSSKKNINDSVSLLLYYGVSKEKVLDLLPDRVYPRFVFADMIARLGNRELSRDVIVDSLEYIENDEHIRTWHFAKIYRVYMKEKNYEMALSVLKKAIHYFPANAQFHNLTGDTYVKMGIQYRAVEEYKQALIIDPNNSNAKKKLARLTT